MAEDNPFLILESTRGTALTHAEDHAIEFTKEFLSRIIATNKYVLLHSINLKVKETNLVLTIKYNEKTHEEIILTGVTDASKYNALFVNGHFIITDPIYAWAQICGYSVNNGYIKVNFPKDMEGMTMHEQLNQMFT